MGHVLLVRLPACFVAIAVIFVVGWLYGPEYGPDWLRRTRNAVCYASPTACAWLGMDDYPIEPGHFYWRSGDNKKVLVFVHGVTGTSSGTWQYSDPSGAKAYWPEIVKGDSRLKDYDIYVASYFTPQLDAGPTIGSLARAIRSDLEKARILPEPKDSSNKATYEEVIFICHSMGNLIIRNMIVLNQSQDGSVVRIPLILSLASPSTGSALTELLAAGNANPTFKEMAKYETNSFLQLLNEMYKGSPIDTEIACAYEGKKMGQPLNRLVVEKASATAVCTRPDPQGFEKQDHISIVKPSDKSHPVHEWAVQQILQEQRKPGWVLDRWANKEIIVGGKDYVESNLHSAMIKLVLESKLQGLKVTTRYDMGHASRMFAALFNKVVDIYPEYDGSILYGYLRKPLPYGAATAESGNPEAINRELLKNVQSLNMTYLDHFGYNDPYVLVMKRSKAKERGLLKDGKVTASEIVEKAGQDLLVISDQEFFFRNEWFGVKERYGLKSVHFDQTKRDGLYDRLRSEEPSTSKTVPVAVGFRTDPDLWAADLVIVDDDKHALPDYYPAPLVNKLLLRHNANIEPVLEKLHNIMTIEEVRSLVAEYKRLKKESGDTSDDTNSESLEKVAYNFLKAKGIL